MSQSALIRDERDIGSKPRILLYSSCVSEQLRGYLLSDPWVSERFYVDVLLIHVLEYSGITDLNNFPAKEVFGHADYVFTNCFAPKWSMLGLHRVHELRKPSSLLYTWVPPNFSAFWPIVDYHGESGVTELLKQGKSASEIVDSFRNNTFDPLFASRWVEQMARLWDREKDSDIKIAAFCERHHSEIKLWFTENHPTYNVIAWIGSQIVKLLGGEPESEDACVQRQHDLTGQWNTWPETRYEFEHYKFAYPMRYDTTPHWGGLEWYHSLIVKIADKYRNGGAQ